MIVRHLQFIGAVGARALKDPPNAFFVEGVVVPVDDSVAFLRVLEVFALYEAPGVGDEALELFLSVLVLFLVYGIKGWVFAG